MSIRHEASIIGSAVWAAAGDALGWMTELADRSTVRHRTGHEIVYEPLNWKRRIGGRFGPSVNLPAGTYSDDTQLRLAVGRSIRGNGSFDVEAFAKIELPVWMSYSLGAGRGTSAAALNLSKISVNWFSNFFETSSGPVYTSAGGNGACMRIQPHVWKSRTDNVDGFVGDVIRDALVTHGHARGFLGAVFHALCLAEALNSQTIPSPDFWSRSLERLVACERVIKRDEQLALFWLPVWEETNAHSLSAGIAREIEWATNMISVLRKALDKDADYHDVLQICCGLDPTTRGGGLNTAIIASALCWFGRENKNEENLILAANALGSDTDTIASMAGAILGAVRPTDTKWAIQDRDYIVSEAKRIAAVSSGRDAATFRYPELMAWSAPTSQADAVGSFGGSLFLKGLGRANQLGETWEIADAKWQWLELDFGQSVLAKRRRVVKEFARKEVAIGSPESELQNREDSSFQFRPDMDRTKRRSSHPGVKTNGKSAVGTKGVSLDELTTDAIKHNFSAEVVGRGLIEAADSDAGIEGAVAYAAIVAKAFSARRKKERK